MIPKEMEDVVVNRILRDKKPLYDEIVEACRYAISVLKEQFDMFLTEVRFCIRAGKDQYLFDLDSPTLVNTLSENKLGIELYFCSKGKYYPLLQVMDTHYPLTLLSDVLKEFITTFFTADSLFRDAVVRQSKKDFQATLVDMGLGYKWSSRSYTLTREYWLLGVSDELPKVKVGPMANPRTAPDATAFKKTLGLNSKRVINYYLTQKETPE